MAKKKAKPMQATKPVRTGKPVRLDLSPLDHERLERQAKRYGLSKSSYCRMAVMERLEADEKENPA
jgi:hypothetical protein